MSRSIRQRAADARSAASRPTRFADLCISLHEWGKSVADPGPQIVRVGGRFDCELQRWHSEAEHEIRWRVHPGQYEAAYFFADWLHYYSQGLRVDERPPPHTDVSTMLCDGGRGAGKSWFGVACGWMVAIGLRNRIVWMIAPTESSLPELDDVVSSTVPSSWYQYLKSDLCYWVPTGARVEMKSAHVPASLKRGRVDYAFLNESQLTGVETYKMFRPRLADTSGLAYLAGNPPRTSRGQWVMDFHDAAKAGDLPDIRLFEFDRKKNPTMDQRSLETTRVSFGELDYRREIEGEMIPMGDRVFYSWSDLGERGNIRPLPDVGEISEHFLRRKLGRPFAGCIGLDFQRRPHMAGAAKRFFLDPDDPADALSWFVRGITVEGLEEQLSEELLRYYDPREWALIVDASAFWQDSERQQSSSSVMRLKKCGWLWIFKPDETMARNPPITERMQAANARFCDHPTRVRRTFSVPANRELNRALKLYENRNGVPNRRSDFAHLVDAATYPMWRLWPRTIEDERGGMSYEGGPRDPGELGRDLDGL